MGYGLSVDKVDIITQNINVASKLRTYLRLGSLGLNYALN